MYLFSVFADVTGDADTDASFDVDGDADIHMGEGHHGADGYRLLSLRNATYFLFAFGVTGVALTWLWRGSRAGLVAALALGLGAVGAAMSTLVFGWLRRSESGAMPGDRTWLGAQAEVVIPLSHEGTGKVFAEHGGRTQELLARPFDRTAEHPERWTSVLVLEIHDGIALVAPNDLALEGRPDSSQPPRLGAAPTARDRGASTEN